MEVDNSSDTNLQLQKYTPHQRSNKAYYLVPSIMINIFITAGESLDLDSLLLKIRGKISVKLWYQFGLELGVPPDFLEGLQGYPDHNECMIEVADYWLRNHPDKPTWNKVEDSLRKFEMAHVVSVDFPCKLLL